MKKIKNSSRRRILRLAACVLLIAIIAIAALTGYFYWNDSTINATNDASSLRNYELLNDAVRTGDVKLCDQIRGSIHPVKRERSTPPTGIAEGVSAQMPRLNEADAKTNCRERSQRTIDRIKYQNIVCANPSVKEYSFGTGSTYNCPSRP